MTDPSALRGQARWTWLRSAARRVAQHPRGNAAQVAALGRLLLQVKAVLGHGAFRRWLAEHWPHGYRIAAEAMRLAKLPETQSCALRNFGASAVRVLVNGRLPKSRRDRVLSVKSGRDPVKFTDAILHTLDEDERPSEPDDVSAVDPDVTDEERSFLRLAALLRDEQTSMVHISRDADPECPLLVLTLYRDGSASPASFVRADLESLLKAASGDEGERLCPKCGESKPAGAFAKSTTYCRFCERARVKAYTQARRGRRAGSGAG